MTDRKTSNKAASVRARLLNQAHARGVEFQQILNQFALERLLFRLSVSDLRERFLLKGALLFDLWFGEPHRPTRDIDFLGFGSADHAEVAQHFTTLCAITDDDGVIFDASSIRVTDIRQESNYAGVRVTLNGTLDGARFNMQADIGFGDAVTPAVETADYPTILADLHAPKNLCVYPRYTVIAEKLEAITSLGIANSRMKDFFDLWVLVRRSDLQPTVVRQAIVATFGRRGTPLPEHTPVGLSETFAIDDAKIRLWHAFISRNELVAPSLSDVVGFLRTYFGEIVSGFDIARLVE